MPERHPDQPPSREQLAADLALNAATKPFNLAALVVVVAGGLAVGAPFVVALLAAVLIYTLAVGVTLMNADEAERVGEAGRQRRRAAAGAGAAAQRLDPATLAPGIARPLTDARATAERIRDAIRRAELPYAEVGDEVDSLLGTLEASAGRAQLLYEVLRETPPERIERRLAELEGSGKDQLIAALREQLAVQRKVESQLERFVDEIDRLNVELDTIRATLVSLSASTDASNQQRIAADVRALRDEVGAVASGMAEAYERGGGGAA
jgi:hypothetical protein